MEKLWSRIAKKLLRDSNSEKMDIVISTNLMIQIALFSSSFTLQILCLCWWKLQKKSWILHFSFLPFCLWPDNQSKFLVKNLRYTVLFKEKIKPARKNLIFDTWFKNWGFASDWRHKLFEKWTIKNLILPLSIITNNMKTYFS